MPSPSGATANPTGGSNADGGDAGAGAATTLNFSGNVNNSPPLPPLPPVAAPTVAVAATSPTAAAAALPTQQDGASAALPTQQDGASVVSGITATMSVGKPSKHSRARNVVDTTARKSTPAPKKKQPNIKAGRRAYVTRKQLKFLVKVGTPGRNVIDAQDRDDYRYYGSCIKAVHARAWRVKFDALPFDNNVIQVSRNNIICIDDGEEESPYSEKFMAVEATVEECANAAPKKKGRKPDPAKVAVEEFLALPVDLQSKAKSFVHPYGDDPGQKIDWQILADDEQITEDPMDHSTAKDVWKEEIAWDPDPTKMNYNDLFFEKFMVNLEGKAKVLDKYLSDPKCGMFSTTQHDKIKFHQPEWEDPDQLLKLCITLLFTAVLEVERGVENLFKRGQSNGFKDYPDYGQYVPENVFKAFMCGFPFLWCEEKYWYMKPKDLPWDVVLPFVKEYNKKRTDVLRTFYLMLDESMSGWRPKTSKTGGLPNISHEPRKPVPLGTMIRNAVECVTGIFVHHDIVQRTEEQWGKEFGGDIRSHLPKGEAIPYHTAEVLRQAKNAKVEKGGHVGGDAWFGSIASVVELYKRLGLYSTFIIKQNLNYFPMKVLHAILIARYPERPAGKWVVMKATISGVDIFIMAYAWSQKGVAYFVSSCGKTVQHEKYYKSRYEDEYGIVQEKELPRPAIAHFLYEFLPLIDEHNKARQSILALERVWHTKDCWFRVLTTFVGMAFVDMMRCDRNKRAEHSASSSGRFSLDEEDDDFKLKELVNYFARPLRDGHFKLYPRKTNCGRARAKKGDDPRAQKLVRVQNADGHTTYDNGRAVNLTCFICRKYRTKQQMTNWQCKECDMPLCQQKRRDKSCLEEHLNSQDQHLGCGFMKRKRNQFQMPSHLKFCEPTDAAVTPSPPKRRKRRGRRA